MRKRKAGIERSYRKKCYANSTFREVKLENITSW